MLGTIKHYLSSFSKYLVNNCSMKSIAVEPVKGLKKDKNLSSKSLLTTWGDNGRRDMQAKRHHYKATENMQKKKKKKVAKCCGSAEEKPSIVESLWKMRDLELDSEE